jgi:hypothetical protein
VEAIRMMHSARWAESDHKTCTLPHEHALGSEDYGG